MNESRLDERRKTRVFRWQNKLEIPRDKAEVNKREIHERDGRVHDPDTMVAPLTPREMFVWSCLLLINKTRAKDKNYIWVSVYSRYDERLKTKDEESTRLTWTGFPVELEHLKIETTLIDEMFASVMGEYVFLKW